MNARACAGNVLNYRCDVFHRSIGIDFATFEAESHTKSVSSSDVISNSSVIWKIFSCE